MTLLSVVRDVCATVGVLQPQSVFSNITGNRTMQEMLALANEMAQRIGYDYREWSLMMAEGTLTGGLDPLAGPGYYRLPANFLRMSVTANVWRSSMPQTPMRFIADSDEWLQRRLSNQNDGRGEWMLAGRAYMRIFPLLADTDTVKFIYMDKNFVNPHGDGLSESDVFLNDDDTFWLDERLLKLGMIWQWKAQKGSPYAEDMGTYGDALAKAMASDKPAPIFLGRGPISASARTAIPTQTIYFPGATPP